MLQRISEVTGVRFVDGLTFPVKANWKIVPVAADSDYLTDYVSAFIDFARSVGGIIAVEQFFPDQPEKAIIF